MLLGMEHVISLETLNFSRCGKLQSIPRLGQLMKLGFLYVEEIQEFPGVMEHLTSLEMLDVRGCQKLQSIPGLGQAHKAQNTICDRMLRDRRTAWCGVFDFFGDIVCYKM